MLKMSDIAEKAGVSPSTVSFVLNDRHTQVRISEATRQKVLKAAEELGYRANHAARAIRTGNTRMIGIVGGDLGREQVGRMVAGALEVVDAHDYTLKILPSRPGDSPETVQNVVRLGSQLRLTGVIAMHVPQDTVEKLAVEAKRYGYPMLLLDGRVPGLGLHQVVSDDESGIADVMAHLVSLGHERIAMISGMKLSTIVPSREAAFCAELSRHGLSLPSDFMGHGDFDDHAPNVAAARALLDRPKAQRPTALFCAGDRIAMTALQVAAELGLRVPQELSVVGFADLAMAEFATPPLTTVRQDFHAMGRLAAQRLLQACPPDDSYDKSSDAFSRRAELEPLPTRLIVRRTTGPALL